MADVFSMISVISYIAAGIFFAAAAAIWFLFRIPSVLGDLSGRNAKKTMEKKRKENERAGKGNRYAENQYETDLLREKKAKVSTEDDTTPLVEDDTTELLIGETDTMLLTEVQKNAGGPYREAVDLRIINEVIFLHTDEILPI